MTIDSNILTQLVCTRLSHDIVGNVGAVANAVELLEEGDMDFMDDIKSILKTSSSVLSARMRFFRLAFGLDNANLENMEFLEKTIRDYLGTIGNRNYPLELDFQIKDVSFSREVLLAVMIIADMMIRGGKITIAEKEGKLWVVSEGTLAPSEDKMLHLKEILGGCRTELNAQFAPSYYLVSQAEETGVKLYLLKSDFPCFMFERKGQE